MTCCHAALSLQHVMTRCHDNTSWRFVITTRHDALSWQHVVALGREARHGIVPSLVTVRDGTTGCFSWRTGGGELRKLESIHLRPNGPNKGDEPSQKFSGCCKKNDVFMIWKMVSQGKDTFCYCNWPPPTQILWWRISASRYPLEWSIRDWLPGNLGTYESRMFGWCQPVATALRNRKEVIGNFAEVLLKVLRSLSETSQKFAFARFPWGI